jgi:acetyltransferase, GNAT family
MNYEIIKYSDINPQSLRKVFKSLSLEYLGGTSIIHGKSQVGFFLREFAYPNYPNIDTWYQKIVSEINNDPKSREMFICLSNEKNLLSISGLMILKNTCDEKKICTLRVNENYQGKGIASELIQKAFDFLKTEKPLITVPEESVEVFSNIFNKYGFEKKDEIHDLYREKKIEHIYNGFFR